MTLESGSILELFNREKKAKAICAQLNNFTDLKPTLITVIHHIKELTHCEAVSIRLHDNGDYPYYVYNGFSESFIMKENSLCSKDRKGNRIPSQEKGDYLLDCMCGNIIRGTFDPSLPFFTIKGSFWSNNTTALLASTSENERQGRTRNYCNSCGYESVALIPIQIRDKRIGLVQLNDKRVGMFSEDLIEYMEMIGEQIGLAVDNAYKYEKIVGQKYEISQTIDKLRKTQRQLVEAEKMALLGNLVAGVAHEINTPVGIGITAVSTLADRNIELRHLFKDKKLSHSNLEKHIEFTGKTIDLILRNLQRTGDLIQSFKKASIDQLSESKKHFNVKSYLHDVVRSIEPKLKNKQIRIEIDCSKEIELYSYPDAFAQVISNLLLNSLIHGFENKNTGEIYILTNIKDDNLSLTYQDNGKGIPPEIRKKIYEPFFSTNKQIGTGLGMHIVYNLVTQKLKGSITCEDQVVNGAAFTIVLPLTNRKKQ
jgi:signal transduction histidine kinase